MTEIYAEWKSWQAADFGRLPKDEACYFAKLMRQSPALLALDAGSKVLEIGFGNGAFMRFAKDRGMAVAGVDIVPELVQRARQSGYAAFGSVDELLAAPAAADALRFDAVFLFDVLEHLNPEQIVALFHQLRSCASDAAVVVMRFPNGGGPLGLANQHGDPTHRTALTASKLDFFLHGTGWRLQSCRGDVFPVWNGRPAKLPHRALAFALRTVLEKLFRLIYFPQSRGVLSANLLAVLARLPDR